MDIDETPYAHERLAPGALHEPNTIYLNFDLGTDGDARRKLLEMLLRFGATPKETFVVHPDRTEYSISFPIHVQDQLANYGLLSLRLLDELDVEPCSVQLRHVIAHYDGNGQIRRTQPADLSAWTDVRTGYVASHPKTIHAHHIVTIRKRGQEPPAGWALVAEADAWQFRLTKPIKMIDAAKLKKNGQGAIVVEEVLACWNYPLQHSGDNRHRTSLKGLAGVSDRRLPDFAELFASTKNKPEQKLLVRDEAARSKIIAAIEPFRRIAIAQGLNPLVIGLGLIPVGETFGKYFCTQAAAYGSTQQEAEAILEAYGSLIWFLVHSGYSPIMSHPDLYDQVLFWSSVLPESKSNPKKMQKTSNGTAIAAGAQVLSVEPMRQLKRLEDAVIDSLSRTIGRSEKFQLENAGLLGVPFRADGLGGCLFALLTGPNLDKHQLDQLAIRQSIFLHRNAFKGKPVETKKVVKAASVKSNLRIEQVLDHDKVWNAFEQIWHKAPSHRLKIQLLKKYSLLETMQSEIENSQKLSSLMESIWMKMTGLTRTSLYKYREKAGLPSRKLTS